MAPGPLPAELCCWSQQESLDADLVYNSKTKYDIEKAWSVLQVHLWIHYTWKLFFMLNGVTWLCRCCIFTFICRPIHVSVLELNSHPECLHKHTLRYIRWPSVSSGLIGSLRGLPYAVAKLFLPWFPWAPEHPDLMVKCCGGNFWTEKGNLLWFNHVSMGIRNTARYWTMYQTPKKAQMKSFSPIVKCGTVLSLHTGVNMCAQ